MVDTKVRLGQEGLLEPAGSATRLDLELERFRKCERAVGVCSKPGVVERQHVTANGSALALHIDGAWARRPGANRQPKHKQSR
mgnify:CR=1 FL=1